MTLSLALIGPLVATIDQERLPESRARKIEALLIYLMMEAAYAHRRETLIGLLFPNTSDELAHSNLRQTITRLRRAIDDSKATVPYLLTTQGTTQFNRQSDYELDVEDFHTNLQGCGRHLGQRDGRCLDCMQKVARAIELYRGPFLEGFYLEDSAAFDEWMLLQRERLQQEALAALKELADFHERRGEYDTAVGYTRRYLEIEPWREAAQRQLMRMLAFQGQRNSALKQYETLRHILKSELGVEPTTETQNLHTQISIATAERPHNLPPAGVDLVGRSRELAAIHEQLADPAQRLVVLVGPGGIGKTELALAAARHTAGGYLGPFMHGVYFVPLAPIAGRAQSASAEAVSLQLVTAVADAISFSFSGKETPWQQLLNYLHDKSMLLVLDNLEHVMAAARQLLLAILQQAAGVKFIVTSRERLTLIKAWTMEVDGLAYPELVPTAGKALVGYNALRLFVERARQVNSDFALAEDENAAADHPCTAVAATRICQLVQGIPLAIELAAAWVRILSCPEIAAEIDRNLDLLSTAVLDAPERHHSIRAVFEQSWQLLAPDEQMAARRLSIFRGGFSRQAAVTVTGATLGQLAQLIDKSLLRRQSPADHHSARFEMLEVLRQSAADKAASQEKTAELLALHERHATFYLTLLAERRAELKGKDQRRALTDIRREIENIRAAWAWAVEQGRVDLIGVALEDLAQYLDARSWFQEGEQLFRETVSRLAQTAGAAAATREYALVMARLQARQGWFAFHLGNHAESMALLQASLAQLTQLGAEADTVFNLNYLGAVCRHLEQYETAVDHLQQALDRAEAHQDQFGASIALNNLGMIAWRQGRLAEARALCQRSLTIKRAIGDRWGEAFSLAYLGRIAQDLGEHAEAQELLQASLAISQEIGDRRNSALIWRNLGDIACLNGQLAQARHYYHESLQVFREIANQMEIDRTLALIAPLS